MFYLWHSLLILGNYDWSGFKWGLMNNTFIYVIQHQSMRSRGFRKIKLTAAEALLKTRQIQYRRSTLKKYRACLYVVTSSSFHDPIKRKWPCTNSLKTDSNLITQTISWRWFWHFWLSSSLACQQHLLCVHINNQLSCFCVSAAVQPTSSGWTPLPGIR